MAFPKKHTRKIVVDDEAYLWHLNQNAIDTNTPNHITIQQADRGRVLYLDPYPWSFQIRPSTIERAIRWALKNGWSPYSQGPPLYIGYRKDRFFVLPPHAKFTWDVFDDIEK